MSKKLAKLGLLVGIVGLAGVWGVADARHDDDCDHDDRNAPSTAQTEHAQQTSDLLVNTVIAALLQEINETTPQNAAQGNVSIGLVFNDRNRDIRLVGTLAPMSNNDLPADRFERDALAKAMTGQPFTAVERMNGDWFFRRSVPLSNFQAQCAMCHANFRTLSSTDWVGALMVRVPIE